MTIVETRYKVISKQIPNIPPPASPAAVDVETFVTPSSPPHLFRGTATDAEVFFHAAVEVGVMDAMGNCLLDPSVIQIPCLSQAGVDRLKNRLTRRFGKMTKDLGKLPPGKLIRIKGVFEKISTYCQEKKIVNPFKIDFKLKIVEIEGFNFNLEEFSAHLLKNSDGKIRDIEVFGGDLPAIGGPEFCEEAVRNIGRAELTAVWSDALCHKFRQMAPDLDIRISCPCGGYDALETIVGKVMDFLVLQLFNSNAAEIFGEVRFLIKELAFSKLKHVYKNCNGRIDNFFILSLEDVLGMNIDLDFVDTQVRRQLFHSNGLSMSIIPWLERGTEEFVVLTPMGEGCGGWQAVLDRICDIAAISHPELPVDHGWSRLLSAYVRGYRCVNPALEERLLHDVRILRADQIADEVCQVAKDHNGGSHDAIFSMVFMLSAYLEGKLPAAFIADIWTSLKHRLGMVTWRMKMNPTCRSVLEMIWVGKRSFSEVAALLQVIYSYRMALPHAGGMGERLVSIGDKNFLRVCLCENMFLTLPFNLVNSVEVVTKLLHSEAKRPVLELFESEMQNRATESDLPSVFSLYGSLSNILPKMVLKAMEGWRNFKLPLLDRISFGFSIAFAEISREQLASHCKRVGTMLIASSADGGLISYLVEIDRKYSCILDKSIFHSFIEEYRKRKDSKYKGHPPLVNYFSALLGSKIPELTRVCFHLWFSIREKKLKNQYGIDLVSLMKKEQPLWALKVLSNVSIEQKKVLNIINVILSTHSTKEIFKSVHQVISKGNWFTTSSASGKHQTNKYYLKEIFFWKIAHYLLTHEGPISTCGFIRNCIVKRIVLMNNNNCESMLQFLPKIVLHPASDQALIKRLSEDALLPLQEKPRFRSSYQDILRQAIERLRIDGIKEAISRGDLSGAKNECSEMMAEAVICNEFHEVFLLLLSSLVKAARYDELFHFLLHPKISLLLSDEQMRVYVVDAVRSSHPDSKGHLLILGFALEFVEREGCLEELFPYLMRQLESVLLERLQSEDVWTAFKSQLLKKRNTLVERLERDGQHVRLLQLAHSFHLWGISIDGIDGSIINALVMQRHEVPANVVQNLLRSLLKVFGGGVNECGDDQQLAERLLQVFDLPVVQQKPILAARLLIAVKQLPCDNEGLAQKVYEYLSVLLTEYQSEALAPIELLLDHFTFGDTYFCKERLKGVFEKVEDVEVKIRLMVMIYRNGVKGIEEMREDVSPRLVHLLDLRYHFRKIPHGISVDEELIEDDVKLLTFCARSGSWNVAIYSFGIFVDMSRMIVERTETFFKLGDPSIKGLKTNGVNAELALLHYYGEERTNQIHDAFKALFLRYMQLEGGMSGEQSEMLAKMAHKLIRYVRIYCIKRKELLMDVCKAFPESTITQLLYEYSSIFFRLIEDPPSQAIAANDPVYVRLFMQILSRLVSPTHDAVLTHPNLSYFFDRAQITKFWVTYIFKQTEYLNLFKKDEIIHFFVATLENLSLFVSEEALMKEVLERLWSFAIYIEYFFFKEGLNYFKIFNATMVRRFSYITSTHMSGRNIIELLKNPQASPPRSHMKAISTDKLMEASHGYFFYKEQFCSRLMDIDGIFELLNRVVRVSRELVFVDGEKRKIEIIEKLPQHASVEVIDELDPEFTVRHFIFIKNTIIEMIDGYRHCSKTLVELISEFIFMKLPKKNCHDIFECHLKVAKELYHYGIARGVFAENILNDSHLFISCLTYCDPIKLKGIPLDDTSINIVSQTLSIIYEYANISQVSHGMRVLFFLSEHIYGDHPDQFIEIFNKLMAVVKANPFFICRQISVAESSTVDINSPAIGSSSSVIEGAQGFVSLGVDQIPLCAYAGVAMIRDGKFIFSNLKAEGQPRIAARLLEIYIDALFELRTLELPEGWDYEKYDIIRFLVEYIANAALSGGYTQCDDLLERHMEQMEPLYFLYLNDARVLDKKAAHEAYKKLLFARPVFKRVHDWILLLLQSRNLDHMAGGKAVFTKALQLGLYAECKGQMNDVLSYFRS